MRTALRPTAVILVFVAVLGVVAGSAGPNSGFHAGVGSGPGATAYGPIRVPLRYAPTWLPPGIVERERWVFSARSLSGGPVKSFSDGPVNSFDYWRAWESPTARPYDGSLSVTMSVAVDSRDRGDCPHGENVAINDVPGNYYFALGQPGPASCVTWHPDPQTALQINQDSKGPGLSREDMLRIARSVRADSTLLVVPLRVVNIGGFVHGTGFTSAHLKGDSPSNWSAGTGMGLTETGSLGLGFRIGTTTPVPAGAAVRTVMGRPARISVDTTSRSQKASLVVDLGNGLLLTVTYWAEDDTLPPEPEPETVLIKVAERTRIGTPDMSWIGTRPG